MILAPINKMESSEVYFINEDQLEVYDPIKLTISNQNFHTNTDNSIIFVDADKLKFQEGAVFSPFGMNGKTKKVSKLFKDEKLSLLQKENTWILYSNEEIVWVIGIRQDDRFKIDSNTKNSLQIALK